MNTFVKPILVLGAYGKTGSRICQKLDEMQVPLRRGSRNATPPFDWENQSTWKKAVEEVRSVYLSFQPDLAVPGAPGIIKDFCSLAKSCGVEKIVLLSGRGEREAEWCEKIVQQSGLRWTIARASWFNQNFSENYLLEPVLSGLVSLPVEAVKEPFVDAQDIADVVVAALTKEGHDGMLYELTGPRLLTFREAVTEIALATGRDIRYRYITMEEYQKQLEAEYVPAEYIWLISYLFTEVLDGRNASVANGVQKALGREPIDFSQYVKETAAAGNWNVRQ